MQQIKCLLLFVLILLGGSSGFSESAEALPAAPDYEEQIIDRFEASIEKWNASKKLDDLIYQSGQSAKNIDILSKAKAALKLKNMRLPKLEYNRNGRRIVLKNPEAASAEHRDLKILIFSFKPLAIYFDGHLYTLKQKTPEAVADYLLSEFAKNQTSDSKQKTSAKKSALFSLLLPQTEAAFFGDTFVRLWQMFGVYSGITAITTIWQNYKTYDKAKDDDKKFKENFPHEAEAAAPLYTNLNDKLKNTSTKLQFIECNTSKKTLKAFSWLDANGDTINVTFKDWGKLDNNEKVVTELRYDHNKKICKYSVALDAWQVPSDCPKPPIDSPEKVLTSNLPIQELQECCTNAICTAHAAEDLYAKGGPGSSWTAAQQQKDATPPPAPANSAQ